jgi:hypothetical protein
MTDDDLIENLGVLEIYVDGFCDHAARNGVMTCIGYRKMKDGTYVVLRLAWPVVNTTEAIDCASAAMDTADRLICDGMSKHSH